MKSKEYKSEISTLQSEMAEYDKIEENIQKHLDKVRLNQTRLNLDWIKICEWSKLEQSKRSSLRSRVNQTIEKLEEQKVICRKKAKIKNEVKKGLYTV